MNSVVTFISLFNGAGAGGLTNAIAYRLWRMSLLILQYKTTGNTMARDGWRETSSLPLLVLAINVVWLFVKTLALLSSLLITSSVHEIPNVVGALDSPRLYGADRCPCGHAVPSLKTLAVPGLRYATCAVHHLSIAKKAALAVF